MWPRLRAVVESEDTFDDISEVLWHAYRAGTSSERLLSLRHSIRLEPNTESRFHRLDRSGESHRALCDAALHNVEPVFVRKFFDLLDVRGIGAVSRAKLFARERLSFDLRYFRAWLTPETDGDFETLVRGNPLL